MTDVAVAEGPQPGGPDGPREKPVQGPPPELVFRRLVRPFAMVRELWGARELVMALAEREFRARYKQTKLGFAWSIITPLLLMVVFTVFFQPAANIDTQGAPYAIFTYLALLPWTFFNDSVAKGGVSITMNLSLVNKVYCPREVFPLSNVLMASFDTLIATTILGFIFLGFGEAPDLAVLPWLPVLLGIQVAFTVGVTLVVSAVVVYFRDLRQVLPMILQVGLLATPIAWPLIDIPHRWRGLYSAINPLGPVIHGYRQTILYGEPPAEKLLAFAGGTSFVCLVGGYLLFKRLETGFADVA